MRQIGELAKATLPESQSTSGITTSQRGMSHKTGLQAGGHGLPIITAFLETGVEPSEADRALVASLPPSVKISLQSKVRTWDTSGEFLGEVVGYELKGYVSEPERMHALDMVAHSLSPMSMSEAQKLLGKLRILTKVRAESVDDIRATFAIYAQELAEFPADVVRKVLTTQHKISKWWPAWAELEDRLRFYARTRHNLHNALKQRSKAND
jgi:hypothetical protein